ncbi:MAG: NUDIX domain-containing protein [Halanaerobium sp.]
MGSNRRYPEATVGAVILNPENKVLICKSNKWNQKYVIPGGHIEAGEKMEEALVREVREETGLAIYDIELLGITESIYSESFQNQKHFLFVDFICRSDSTEVELNHEAQSYQWIDLSEIEAYELEEFTSNLLKELRKGDSSKYRQEIIYGL